MASNAPDDPKVLLGFDAREMVRPASAWNAERRELFLLRPDVERPLSVDTAVWPSVYGEPPHVEWHGPNQSLWDDLERMDERLQAIPSTARWRIAVGWLVENAGAHTGPGATPPYIAETRPGAAAEAWSVIGFDVADGWLTSGLTNCSYLASERAIFRRDWSGELNEHHLFESPATARAFRDASNRRVPEHAPFFVFALLRIDDEAD
jgi:hypothetical protein